MNKIKNDYISSIQNHQDHSIVQASIWTFRTVRDLRSVTKKSEVLTNCDRVKILFRGIIAALSWLPVNVIAIPYIFARSNTGKKRHTPQLHEIIPGLFLGTDQAAKSKIHLGQAGITSVLSILDTPINVPKEQINNHLWIQMEDYPDVDIAPIVQQALQFVREAHQKNEKVLIHCQMGMSRSASITVMVVQHLLDIEAKEALDHVKSKRPVIDINYGFKKQIKRASNSQGGHRPIPQLA